jgi:hypothetical protein
MRKDISPDGDGDGVAEGEGTLYPGICAGEEIPPGYAPYDAVPWDCDDSTPELFNTICLDADGDGWCAPDTGQCVGAEIPAGFRLGHTASDSGTDCNDGDPTRQQTIFFDEDQDGDVADSHHPSDCVSSVEPHPGGYVRPGSDCNDRDPGVSGLAVDVLFDGQDTNCDGDDGAAQCSRGGMSDVCSCWPRSSCLAAPTCSDRPDLNIVDTEFTGQIICSTASATSSILVVNTGGIAFVGSVEVRPVPSYPSSTISLTLAPGESRILRLYPDIFKVELRVITGDDCQVENNSATISVRGASCDE